MKSTNVSLTSGTNKLEGDKYKGV